MAAAAMEGWMGGGAKRAGDKKGGDGDDNSFIARRGLFPSEEVANL